MFSITHYISAVNRWLQTPRRKEDVHYDSSRNWNTELGRSCLGQKVDTVYVGTLDISNIKVGTAIDVAYDKAIQTKNGVFQPIKRIDVIK